MTISELSSRVLVRTTYRLAPSHFPQALMVSGLMLEEHVIDFDRYAPTYQQINPEDALRINDVVLGFSDLSRKELVAVALYHPALPAPSGQAVGLGSLTTLGLRMENLENAVCVLAMLIYRLTNRRPLSFSELKNLEVHLFSEDEVRLFLELLKTVHKIRTNQRKSVRLLEQLIPSTLHKIFTKEQTTDVKDWLELNQN